MHRSSFTMPLKNLSIQEPIIVVEETQFTDYHDDAVQGATALRHNDNDNDNGKIETCIKVTTKINNNNSNSNSNSSNSSNSKHINNSNNNNNNNNNNNETRGLDKVHAGNVDVGSPKNPYLLCPFPDMQQRRKHSLPSLQISEGMMASQVRRLSDVGGETGTLTPHDVEFLTTLTQQQSNATTSNGRRHSVVTISALPATTLFGRNRRDSISSVSFSRRGSGFQGPPLTDHRGSIHNLQLDIMDGIVQTRKSRGSAVWTAPILKETESNVQLQA